MKSSGLLNFFLSTIARMSYQRQGVSFLFFISDTKQFREHFRHCVYTAVQHVLIKLRLSLAFTFTSVISVTLAHVIRTIATMAHIAYNTRDTCHDAIAFLRTEIILYSYKYKIIHIFSQSFILVNLERDKIGLLENLN